VTDRLLLDTHIALWFEGGHEGLLAATRNLIEDCWNGGGSICLSAVSVWEIAMLVHAGRIKFQIPIELWVERFLDRPGMVTVPLDYRAAARSYRLHHLEHRDPADRLLIATAIDLGCPLVTYDDSIRRFAEAHGSQYGFAIAA